MTDPPESLLDAAAEEMERRSVPGISIAFIEDLGVTSLFGLGVQSIAGGRPVDEGTVYEGASTGKPLLAYAVLMLAGDGTLPLDAPLVDAEGLAEFKGIDVAPITPRMILSHTSGIGNFDPAEGRPVIVGPPGSGFSYSTTAYNLLQGIVETTSEKPLDDLMSDLVFAPLGMVDTSFVWRDRYETAGAIGHDDEGREMEKSKPASADAASGVHTTARDFATFLGAVIDRNRLPAAIREPMLSPQAEVRVDWGGGPPKDTRWTLGWGLTRVGGETHLWHWGWNDGFKSFASASLDDLRGIVVMTNGDNGLWVAKGLVNSYFDAEHPAFAWLVH